MIRQADWIIDLGPEGGSAGGEVLFEGTPADLIHAPRSITGQFLARHEAGAQTTPLPDGEGLGAGF